MKANRFPTERSLLVAPGVPLIHRDLSWLQFNERVLSESTTVENPLLERLRFLAITASNLDEFFMIRVARLARFIEESWKNNQHSSRQNRLRRQTTILLKVSRFIRKQNSCFESLRKLLGTHGIEIPIRMNPGHPHLRAGQEIFEREVLPQLKGPESEIPVFLKKLENLQLAVLLQPPGNAPAVLFSIPKTVPWFFPVRTSDGKLICFLLDDLIRTFLGRSYGTRTAPIPFRLTRNADFTVELEDEDTESVPDIVRRSLGSRDLGSAVRLQVLGSGPSDVLSRMCTLLKLKPQQVFFTTGSLSLHALAGFANHCSREFPRASRLLYPAVRATVPKLLENTERIFETLDQQDILLHHPYDSFDAYIRWIQAACKDPNVVQIEQTVYRMDVLSPVIPALKQAAKTKTVRVIIELRARFDELNNLRLADELRQAGVKVAFGFGRLKIHAKVALVTRSLPGRIRHYTHLSTGNYNSTTARQYTDLAIMTSDPEIGADARYFFDAIFRHEVPKNFHSLVSAPTQLHRKISSLIQAEIQAARKGQDARIIAKVNALVDGRLIRQLYDASRSGVRVDLIVRGACSLIPGIPEMSTNIRVISIVDRFLEHSRVYYFRSSKVIYLSSADWMPRNFFSRLEIAFPVRDPQLFHYLESVLLPIHLSDRIKARELAPDGTWHRIGREPIQWSLWRPFLEKITGRHPIIRSQFLFEEMAVSRYRHTPLEHRQGEDKQPNSGKGRRSP